MKKYSWSLFLLILAWTPVYASSVQWDPARPARSQTVTIALPDFSPGDVLHWAVNAHGESWRRPDPVYQPAGSSLFGNAVRTRFEAVEDKPGTGHVILGPFNHPNQDVDAVVFAVSRADGSWDNHRGEDYLIPFSAGRISVYPAQPSADDVIEIVVLNSQPGGQLRWGVNAQRDRWTPVHEVYRPAGSILAEDETGVDSPLGDPDERGRSLIRVGPFNRGEQVVTSLHLAAHWDDDWDTDGGRNYNVDIRWRDAGDPMAPRFTEPLPNSAAQDTVRVRLDTALEDSVELWLNGEQAGMLSPPAYQTEIGMDALPYGPHRLTARHQREGRTRLDTVTFWHVPDMVVHPLPDGTGFGATDNGDGTVTFALYAPGKHFVSLIGCFNEWDSEADRMHSTSDGTWWLTRELEPGTYRYQYDIEGAIRLADPYARQIDWTNEEGVKGWKPKDARTVFHVGAKPFTWTAENYTRPALEELVVYELYLEDLVPGGGFLGAIDKLDYIADMGFNAIEPLPWHPWAGKESWGYNPAYHLAVEQTYGTPEDLKRLIDEAHARGMAVIIDMVLNHAEWGSALYQLYGNDYAASPYFRKYDGHNWGFPKIDQESPAVKRYVADTIRYWIEEYRIDGFRYDATRWTGWKGYNDWGASWFAYVARQVDPDNIQIAEHLPIEPPLITDTEMDTGWHAEYRWRMREMIGRAELNVHAFHEVMDGRHVGFENSFQRMPYTESHDEERVVRELREAGFSEEEVFRRAAMAIVLTLTTPGVPMIYAGQEFGEDTLKKVGWNPLNWDLLEQEPNRDLHALMTRMVRLRVNHPALKEDNLRILATDPVTGLALFERDATPHVVQVAANFGRTPVECSVYLHEDAVWRDVVQDTPQPSGTVNITLQPGEARVWATHPER